MIEFRGSREGTSLIELLVAVMLVGVVVTSLGGISFHAARQSSVLAGEGYMQGIVTQEVNRLHGMPFTQLNTGTTCVTVSTGSFPHTRCYSVTVVAGWHKSVTLTVTPAQNGVKPMSFTFSRYEPSSYNPLNFP